MNLLAAAAGAALAIYTIASIASRGVFEYWGADFAAFRSAAEVSRDRGYAGVYDLEWLATPERRLIETYASDSARSGFEVIPVPYLPFFVAPFRWTLWLNPIPGWLLWTALNAAVLLAYSRRLGRAFGARPALSPLVLLVALPTFLTLAFGQVNVWLVVGFGEFLIALQRRRDTVGGLWLGLMLLKPQILVLIAVGLLFSRRWRALAGLGISAALVLLASLWLAGGAGLASLASLWLGYAGNLPTTYPESMMNWRGFMLNLQPILGERLSLAILVAGMVVTALAGVWLWLRTRPERDHQPAAGGSYAASSAVAWHSHVHMALPLVVVIGNGSAWKERRAFWLLSLAVLPSLLFAFVGLFVSAGAAHRVAGSLAFTLNLAVLFNCFRSLERRAVVERGEEAQKEPAGGRTGADTVPHAAHDDNPQGDRARSLSDEPSGAMKAQSEAGPAGAID